MTTTPEQISQLLAGQGDPAALSQVLQQQQVAPTQQSTAAQPDQDEDQTPSGGATMGASMEAKKPGFLAKLFGNADTLAKSNPQAASQPGGWAKALVAGFSGAAQGVMHDFSDAQGNAPGLQRLAQVAANRNQRIQGEQQLQRKNKFEDQEQEDKHQQNMALLAHTKIQQLYTERLIHNLDEESIDKSIAAGEKEIEQTTTGEFGAPIYERDVDSGEYNRFLQDQTKKDPNARVEDFHAVPSGKIADSTQPTGYRTLYTIVGTPKTQKLTQEFVDSVNPGLPDAQKLKAGDNEIPGSYAQWLRQQANNFRTTQDAIKLTRDKSELEELTTEQKLTQAKAIKSMGSDWTTQLSLTGNDPFKALTNIQKMKNPDGSPKYPNAAQTAMDIYGGPKEWETMRNDAANNKAKQDEADAKLAAEKLKERQANTYGDNLDPSLTPEQFRSNLPIATQQEFQAIHEGRQLPLRLQGRSGELTQAGLSYMRAYPDTDGAKLKAYPTVVNDYEHGKQADAILGFGVGMKHAKLMFDNTGPASYVPNSAEAGRYAQDAHYLAVEVAKVLNPNGVATEAEVKQHYDDLTSVLPWKRQSQLKNAIDIIGGKYTELANRWENALPDPKNYRPPMPGISQEAMDNYEYVRNGGKVSKEVQDRMQQQEAQHAQLEKTGQQVPTGAASQKVSLDPKAMKVLQQQKENVPVTFNNGQTWMIKNGQPIQIPTPAQGQ